MGSETQTRGEQKNRCNVRKVGGRQLMPPPLQSDVLPCVLGQPGRGADNGGNQLITPAQSTLCRKMRYECVAQSVSELSSNPL
jgi:hypothetical protein